MAGSDRRVNSWTVHCLEVAWYTTKVGSYCPLVSKRSRAVQQECHVVQPHGTAATGGSPPGSLASHADNDLLICCNGGNVMKV